MYQLPSDFNLYLLCVQFVIFFFQIVQNIKFQFHIIAYVTTTYHSFLVTDGPYIRWIETDELTVADFDGRVLFFVHIVRRDIRMFKKIGRSTFLGTLLVRQNSWHVGVPELYNILSDLMRYKIMTFLSGKVSAIWFCIKERVVIFGCGCCLSQSKLIGDTFFEYQFVSSLMLCSSAVWRYFFWILSLFHHWCYVLQLFSFLLCSCFEIFHMFFDVWCY